MRISDWSSDVCSSDLRRVRDLTDKLEADMKAEPGLFEAKRKQIARRARNQKAPYNNIAAVEASTTLPFGEGLKHDRALVERKRVVVGKGVVVRGDTGSGR